MIDGIWTYGRDDIWTGIRDCYADLTSNVKEEYGMTLESIGAIGFSKA